nr:MAG TPA: hypothetical protein [Caudoviricetes sp.]
MKQNILEVLDKSTNNGMKAEEIINIIEQAITQAQYDMWDMCKADRNRPSINSVDWAVAMIENKLFGRLDDGK